MLPPEFVQPDPSNSDSFAAALQHALGGSGDRPYLGNLQEVDSLVRTFLSEDLERAVAKSTGTLTNAQCDQQAHAAVVRLARIFTGQDARYTPIPGWHNAPLLGGSLTLHTHIQRHLAEWVAPQHLVELSSAVQALFAVYLHRYRAAMSRWIASDNADEFQAIGEKLADQLTRVLLGQADK